jgi:hypothetical protein
LIFFNDPVAPPSQTYSISNKGALHSPLSTLPL